MSITESEKWLMLCDSNCRQKECFPNCEGCDVAIEFRYYMQKERVEGGEQVGNN